MQIMCTLSSIFSKSCPIIVCPIGISALAHESTGIEKESGHGSEQGYEAAAAAGSGYLRATSAAAAMSVSVASLGVDFQD